METLSPFLLPVVGIITPPPPHRATVHVRVNDVNEFSPVFVERRYEASVPEGRLFDRIVRVEALDADCSPQYSQICFYDIITPNVPFAIDNDGEIDTFGRRPGPGPIKAPGFAQVAILPSYLLPLISKAS